jgi:hypothetical protein
MGFTLRGCESKWRYSSKCGKRAACQTRAYYYYSRSSELIALFPVVYLISSDIEDVKQTEVYPLPGSTASTLIDSFSALYATLEGRSLAESVMSSTFKHFVNKQC